MGFEIIPYYSFEELSESRRENIVIAYAIDFGMTTVLKAHLRLLLFLLFS